MPDINSTQSGAGFSVQTQSPGFSTPGYNGAGWDALFSAQGNKQAAREAEDRRRWDIENKRKEEMMQEQRRQENMAEQQRGINQRTAPATEWLDAPAMKIQGYTGPSGMTRVQAGSGAAQVGAYGLRGY